jgi:F-type H+-transporting ATPase subunit b
MLQLDLQQIVSQALSFLLLLWVLRRFAWRPLLAILDQRRARIEEELRAVAQRQGEVARLQAEYTKKLATIHEEARAKIQESILEGKRIALEIQEEARAQGRAILGKAKETVELELAKAKVTLRDEVAGMTMEALERILRRKLDAEADRALVEAVLGELEGDRARVS